MKARLSSDDAVRKILKDLGPRFAKRAGVYTIVVKLGERDGDKAPMARIELVERPKKVAKKATKKKEEKKKEGKVVEKEEKVEIPKKEKRLAPKKAARKKIEPKQREQRQKRMSNV